MRRLMPALLIWLLCNAGAFAIENPVKSSAEIPRNALFDQLIGTWDVRYEYLDKKGNPKSNQGQVHYAWILVGKALQEIWSSNSDSKDLLPFGTMIDFYDLKHQRWTAVWIYPAEGMTMIMTGGKVNGSLVPARFSVGRHQTLANVTRLLSALKFPMTTARRGYRWK